MIVLFITVIFLIMIQIVSFYIYNRLFFLKWISPSTKIKNEWINTRDRTILVISLFFMLLSFLMIKEINSKNVNLSVFYSSLILGMTIMSRLFHSKEFEVFRKKINKKVAHKKIIIISDKFELKKISENDLFELISKPYKDCFSSDLKIFKNVFIDIDNNSEKLTSISRVHRNKLLGFDKIFELMNDLSEQGILDLFGDERAKLLEFIVENFQRENTNIIESNLSTYYCKWRKKNT